MDLCQQSDAFLFNTLSRFVIAFLPRSNRLLISSLQTPSTVILEPKKRKSIIASTFFPSIYHEVMGLDATILLFKIILSFKLAFSFSSFTLIKRLFSLSSLSSTRGIICISEVMIFLPAILIPACNSSSLVFFIVCSAYKLSKQGDNIQSCHIPFSEA